MEGVTVEEMRFSVKLFTHPTMDFDMDASGEAVGEEALLPPAASSSCLFCSSCSLACLSDSEGMKADLQVASAMMSERTDS